MKLVAGSMGIGAYGTSCASCQPSASVQRIVTMLSVKTRPKPGFSRMAAISSAERGEADGVRVIVEVDMA